MTNKKSKPKESRPIRDQGCNVGTSTKGETVTLSTRLLDGDFLKTF